MTRVIFDISMSLDEFVTAAGVRPEEPLGNGGQRLHEWAFGEDERNRELLAEAVNFVGAVIAGRRTYDLSIPWWGADGPAGPARVPVFVVTHAEPEEVPEGGVYTFVTDGIESALEEAKAVAGEKAVAVMGGAELGRGPLRPPPGQRLIGDYRRADEAHISKWTAASLRLWSTLTFPLLLSGSARRFR